MPAGSSSPAGFCVLAKAWMAARVMHAGVRHAGVMHAGVMQGGGGSDCGWVEAGILRF